MSIHAGMESLLDAQSLADPQKDAVPDSKLLRGYARLAKPSLGQLNIVCASCGDSRLALHAFGDFLLAELGMQHPGRDVTSKKIVHVSMLAPPRDACLPICYAIRTPDCAEGLIGTPKE